MDNNIKLTQYSQTAGCAAKISPLYLAQALQNLKKIPNENLLVGFDTSDDAAVYKINDETAIIQTLDFFTPVVDDPYTFGQIAATNALSDIYAMGGKPVLALNIVAFPTCIGFDILGEILKGGQDKVIESGATLVGGHSIVDSEPKYGLSVTGICHPNYICKNNAVEEGDLLVLTKPLGIGIINTAIKGGLATKEQTENVTRIMTHLNSYPQEMIKTCEIKAMTDVTGFSLMGHLSEMVNGSNLSAEIKIGNIPFIKDSLDYAKMGIIPAGAYKNREFCIDKIAYEKSLGAMPEFDVIFDPQTSGGLLIAVKQKHLDSLLSYLKETALTSSIIGQITKRKEKNIILIM